MKSNESATCKSVAQCRELSLENQAPAGAAGEKLEQMLVQSESIHRFLSLEQCIVFDRGWRNLLVMNPEAAARSPPSTKMRAGNRAVVVVVMAVAVGSGNPHLRVWEAVGLPASPTGRW